MSLPSYVTVAETIERYRTIVDEVVAGPAPNAIPVLASRWSTGLGFPLPESSLPREGNPNARGGACLSLDEPACVAAARLLCGVSDRELTVVARDDWLDAVRKRVADPEATSVAIVLPCWTETTTAMDPSLLTATLRALRDAERRAKTAPCGILTGLDPGSLTYLVAKALLHDGVADRYRRASGAVLLNDMEPIADAFVPWSDSSPDDPIAYMREDDVLAGDALHDAFSAMIFAGHGSTYCGCNGYVCTARGPETDPSAPVESCHFGHACRAHDYGQVDLRLYDASLMAFASCCSGNMDGRYVRAGVPPLALVAAAAAPSLVLTPSGIADGSSLLDVLAPLASAPTAGEAVQRVNAFRAAAGSFGWFYLLGDPSLPSEVWHGDDWFSDAAGEQPGDGGSFPARVDPRGAPLLRVPVAPSTDAARAGSWFLLDDTGTTVPGSGRTYELEDRTELWFAATGGRGHVRLQRHELPSLASNLVSAAERIHEQTAWWGEPLIPHMATLHQAADGICLLDGMLGSVANTIVAGSPGDYQRQHDEAVAAWINAQARCLSSVHETDTEALWPWRLWPVQTQRVLDDQTRTCDVCGFGPVARHRYAMTKRTEREWIECPHCDIVQDWPTESPVVATLRAPLHIDPFDEATATVEVENQGDDEIVGAGLILVSRGASVTATPAIFPVRVPGRSQQSFVSRLELPDDDVLAHDYPLNAVLLLNGQPHWLGRPLLVDDESQGP